MHFYSALSVETEADLAVSKLIEQIHIQAGVSELHPAYDLAILFLSPAFGPVAGEVAAALTEQLSLGMLLGIIAEGVIGDQAEIEGQTAAAVLVASLPGVRITPFVFQSVEWPCMLLEPAEFRRIVDAPEDTRAFILLCDPFSIPVSDVVQAFNLAFPGIPLVGGMASGALRPGGNTLLMNGLAIAGGAVGLALAGPVEIDILISQGCRPIWRPFQVTSANKDEIYAIEGRPPLAWIQELAPELPPDDQQLLESGLFIGRATRSGPEALGRGDFVIRGITSIDYASGAIRVADQIAEGEFIQFHVEDAFTAEEDLEMVLIPQLFREKPAGGLLFSCNTRGTRLYDHPNGDITIIRDNLGEIPLAGCFCAGEIGPSGGRNYRHGQTASLILFRSLPPAGGRGITRKKG